MSSKSNLLLESGLELRWEAEFDRRLAPKKRGSKPVSVGRLLAASAWLDDELCWSEGRVQWRRDQVSRLVDKSAWRQTERALQILAKKGVEAETVARRQQIARWAAPLLEVAAPDLASLCAQSRRGNPGAMTRLKPLLTIEALSSTPLEASPARALVKAWPLSRAVLLELCSPAESYWPPQVSALAALCLSALGEPALVPNAWRRFAAMTAGLDWVNNPRLDPAMVAAAALEGDAALWRYVELAGKPALYPLDSAVLRADACEFGFVQALALAESIAQIEEFWPAFPAACWNQYSGSRRRRARRLREVTALEARWQAAREEAIKALLPSWRAAARRDSVAPALVASWLRSLLELPTHVVTGWAEGAEEPYAVLPSNDVAGLVEATLGDLWDYAKSAAPYAASLPDSQALCQFLREVVTEYMGQKLAPLVRSGAPTVGIGVWRGLQRELTRTVARALRMCDRFGIEFTRAARADAADKSLDSDWGSLDWAQTALHLARLAQGESADDLFHKRDAFGDAATARRWIDEIARLTHDWTSEGRSEVFVAVLTHSFTSVASSRSTFALVPALMPSLVAAVEKWDAETWWKGVYDLSSTLVGMAEEVGDGRLNEENLKAFFPILAEWTVASGCASQVPDRLPHVGCVAALLSKTPDRFRALLPDLWTLLHHDWSEWDTLWRAVKLLHRRPDVAQALRLAFAAAPERTFTALERLGTLAKVGALHEAEPLVLHTDETNVEDVPGWCEMLELDVELATPIQLWRRWALAAKMADAPPKSVAKVLDWPRSWGIEAGTLRRKLESDESISAEARERLEKRAQNLEARLADTAATRAAMREEIREALANATRTAALQALEGMVARTLGARLRFLCGAAAREVDLDADLLNALLLACEVEDNRKWARQILRQHFEDNRTWREELPANARFLSALQARGLDEATWLERFERGRGEWTFWLETEPLGVLQMGNRFNTCLSRNGCNSHSSIANAIDLNKRVAYARDPNGHIIGRQLWALSKEGALVGFTVYSTLPEATREPLRRAFTAYAREFALGCGVELSDEGEVESLVVPVWYDDGVEPWEEKAESTPEAEVDVETAAEEVCQTDAPQ